MVTGEQNRPSIESRMKDVIKTHWRCQQEPPKLKSSPESKADSAWILTFRTLPLHKYTDHPVILGRMGGCQFGSLAWTTLLFIC